VHDADGGIARDSGCHVVGQVGKSLGANLLFLKREERDRREVRNCRFIQNLGIALHLRIIVRQRHVSNSILHTFRAGYVEG